MVAAGVHGAERRGPTATSPRTRGIAAIPGAIVDGVRFLLQHPAAIPPLLAVWVLFTGPAYLLARRRNLRVAVEM